MTGAPLAGVTTGGRLDGGGPGVVDPAADLVVERFDVVGGAFVDGAGTDTGSVGASDECPVRAGADVWAGAGVLDAPHDATVTTATNPARARPAARRRPLALRGDSRSIRPR
jgi:hypothetical protein